MLPKPKLRVINFADWNLNMTRTLILIILLALTACGGGDDCDAGAPVLGKPSAECDDPPKVAGK